MRTRGPSELLAIVLVPAGIVLAALAVALCLFAAAPDDGRHHAPARADAATTESHDEPAADLPESTTARAAAAAAAPASADILAVAARAPRARNRRRPVHRSIVAAGPGRFLLSFDHGFSLRC